MAATAQKAVSSAARQINAVVVSAGLMQKTVKVRVGGQKFDRHIKKVNKFPPHLLTLSRKLTASTALQSACLATRARPERLSPLGGRDLDSAGLAGE